ncbi:2-amino-4-hydroxy-6-hydroxymethyldihydropteridine diphosphokinase [Variovorax sp. DXTD-1]|uniref:2-amino-4-hydroxy-6- hydroxymethyldihydropteridine diphosphokinase n=1 Tax=Variovorax sp. DXTD-1 TaxID=2495592 RepID=UPI000F85E4DD|nr:2-amino-4-hydroxy-6-hydroxymethyldihydropteridine diphosphokinase [Variovorax sp. DXTD-1]RST47180.1 2-amino-4-hydroxy-6-hydroxymethyldihydropteridine diphosphokinase [Variovorax sp. DXTD-1]
MSTSDLPKDGKKSPKASDKAKAAPPRAGGARPPPAGARKGPPGTPPARRAPARAPTSRPRGPRGPREDYPTVQAFVALGANLGDAEAAVKAAMAAIGALQRTQVTARSSLYRSEPVDAEGPDFINAVVAVRTGLDAEQFLVALQRLETQAGRERPFPNAPRTLDLDLLMHGNSVIDTPTLTLPHPRMRERAFVLKPLAEIAPDKVPRAALARVTGQVVKRIV